MENNIIRRKLKFFLKKRIGSIKITKNDSGWYLATYKKHYKKGRAGQMVGIGATIDLLYFDCIDQWRKGLTYRAPKMYKLITFAKNK